MSRRPTDVRPTDVRPSDRCPSVRQMNVCPTDASLNPKGEQEAAEGSSDSSIRKAPKKVSLFVFCTFMNFTGYFLFCLYVQHFQQHSLQKKCPILIYNEEKWCACSYVDKYGLMLSAKMNSSFSLKSVRRARQTHWARIVFEVCKKVLDPHFANFKGEYQKQVQAPIFTSGLTYE